MEGEEYSSHSFSTLALDGGEWSASRPIHALVPGKGPPVPIVQEADQTPNKSIKLQYNIPILLI
jgi:hypothetical protein